MAGKKLPAIFGLWFCGVALTGFAASGRQSGRMVPAYCWPGRCLPGRRRQKRKRCCRWYRHSSRCMWWGGACVHAGRRSRCCQWGWKGSFRADPGVLAEAVDAEQCAGIYIETAGQTVGEFTLLEDVGGGYNRGVNNNRHHGGGGFERWHGCRSL